MRLPMRVIFEAPTVAGLAEHVRTALWAADAKARAVDRARRESRGDRAVTVNELMATLRAQDVRVWLDGDRVRVSAPSGRLTAQLQQELSERKAEIKAYLASLQVPGQEEAA